VPARTATARHHRDTHRRAAEERASRLALGAGDLEPELLVRTVAGRLDGDHAAPEPSLKLAVGHGEPAVETVPGCHVDRVVPARVVADPIPTARNLHERIGQVGHHRRNRIHALHERAQRCQLPGRV